MKSAFNQIFWGYIIVMFDIRIGSFDLIADPIGYYIIVSGLTMLRGNYSLNDKGKGFAVALIFLSIPSVVVDPNHVAIFSGWHIYFFIIELLKLIMIYYIFKIIFEFLDEYGHQIIMDRSKSTYYLYMTINAIFLIVNFFLIMFISPFFVILLIIAVLIMDINFLALLRAIRQLPVE